MELESAKLVEAFDNCADKGQAVGDITNKCLHFLKSLKCDERKLELCHGLLSGAMIKAMKGGGKETSDLLNFAGPAQTLRVVYSNISQSMYVISTTVIDIYSCWVPWGGGACMCVQCSQSITRFFFPPLTNLFLCNVSIRRDNK